MKRFTVISLLILLFLLTSIASSMAGPRDPFDPRLGVILTLNVTGIDSFPADTATVTQAKGTKRVYKFDIKDEIGPPTWRQAQAAFDHAEKINADYILIHMNTFGGTVDAADRIRTKILGSPVPVMVFIDDNAASAGALISIACDSIYMSSGGSIGAATVVDQQGQPLPEKYQSYMRSRLRATAEATGRDPKIAEAMNDPRIYIPGVNDSGKVLSFTAVEAVRHSYCEGIASNVHEVMVKAGITDYQIIEYEPTVIEKMMDILLHPAISGILIMLIIGGIYFEMQTPGIGFPLFVAITAAVLYFAPLYLEGLAANWEIALFILGIILIVIELFVIPGFGVVGISGIVLAVLGLTLSLASHVPSESPVSLPDASSFARSLFIVLISMIVAFVISVYMGGKLIDSRLFGRVVLSASTGTDQGYVSTDISPATLVGQQGKAFTMLRPSGKVEINGEVYDASAITGYIEKGEMIEVVKFESAQLFVKKVI